MDIYKRIYELENEIAALPQGSINMKKIYGKEQPYLQWTENGKSKSKYIKKNEREEIFAGVERRKQLQEELKELKQHSSIDPSKSTDFETSVIIGERLLALTKGVKNWGKRDCFRQLQAYLNSEETDRVCFLFVLHQHMGQLAAQNACTVNQNPHPDTPPLCVLRFAYFFKNEKKPFFS